MTSTAFSISGIYMLAPNQMEFFESLEIDVPEVMSADQLRKAIASATEIANCDFHPVLTPAMLSIINDIASLLPQ